MRVEKDTDAIVSLNGFRKKPTDAHFVIRDFLNASFSNTCVWYEFQLLQKAQAISDSAGEIKIAHLVIVDFYCEELDCAIVIDRAVQLSCNIIELQTSVIEHEFENVKDMLIARALFYSSNDSSILKNQGVQRDISQIENRLNEHASFDLPLSSQYNSRFQNNQIDELIGNAPGWLLHSGISILAFSVLLILLMCSIIRYPDKIIAIGKVSSTQPPFQIVTHRAGQIDQLVATSGMLVRPGDALVYLNNSAHLQDVQLLMKWIEVFESSGEIEELPNSLILGDLQVWYSQLVYILKEMRQSISQDLTNHELSAINREIENVVALKSSIANENDIYSEELSLAQKTKQRADLLFAQGLISLQDVEVAEASLVRVKRQFESLDKSKVQNDIRLDELQARFISVQKERALLVEKFKLRINEVVMLIKGGCEEWKRDNFIYSEITGRLNYHMDLSEKSTVSMQQKLGYILSESGRGDQFIKCNVPSEGVAKLDHGGKAIIKFDAYPYKEYGAMESFISDLSLLPFEKDGVYSYQLQINLQDGLKTNYNRALELRPDMSARVELITEDRSILSRIFNQFVSLIKT